MSSQDLTSARVVDLLRYRQERDRRPLFAADRATPRPALTPVSPFRPLTEREIRHRQRMATFLGMTPESEKSEVRSQK